MSETPRRLSSMNRSHWFSGDPEVTGPTMDTPVGGMSVNVYLFCLTLICTPLIFLGSVYSLTCLLRTRNKNFLVVIMASLAIDDLLYVVALSMFMSMQWGREKVPSSVCTISAALYLLQGVAAALKSSLIVSYNYYTTRRTRLFRGNQQSVPMIWLLAILWAISLLVSVLPVFGWGTFISTPWGCLVDHRSSYVPLLFALYSACLLVLTTFSVPLTYKLLCSAGQQQTRLNPSYHQVTNSTDPAGNVSALENPVDRTLRCLPTDINWSSDVKSQADVLHSSHRQSNGFKHRNQTVEFAQKRFSLILAMMKVVLWLPLMIQLLVHHVTKLENESFESLGFVLTLLAAAITPVFVLSERWIHLPCGCIINCRKNVYTVASEPARAKRRGFEFNLSFQQGYEVYKISQANSCSVEENKSPSHHSLTAFVSECSKFAPVQQKETQSDARVEISTTAPRDSSLRGSTDQSAEACKVTTRQDKGSSKEPRRSGAATPEGSERKLAQEEGRKLELVDWEWCRSKSERTPRQKTDGLSIPLCAFQGTVSLHAPTTGKTLSLSTYEISGEGCKITPVAKKVEVYRSKSVGHEPSAEDMPGCLADTSVKIHLEVLEICENEEALDTVSIVSNISQSSAQARSPSLRYSRRENRFVSVDLAESASYSLIIPTGHSGSDISISIPDTVEAHRQNSCKQHHDRTGYQEEIQLLNEAYRRQEEISNNC
ncbi:probable G-protein coupled receptor 149 [Chiloscyllium plagiosum]|uniref:probable G-protein coupled receptor 149 n=1 Tax=Chiloscyllium plagiosum TaxID=36176 RepID=UPI001CB7FE0A|nr:probable G-protein coupled receptor 149 [Chiloscyllium plagiosum]